MNQNFLCHHHHSDRQSQQIHRHPVVRNFHHLHYSQQHRTLQISQVTEEMASATSVIADNSQEASNKAKKVDELVQ